MAKPQQIAKPAAPKPVAVVPAPPAVADKKPKREKFPVQPDGTVHANFTTKQGVKVKAVWKDEKLCCPTCQRRFPTGPGVPNAAEKAAKAKEKAPKLLDKSRELFAHISQMIRKNAERAGEEPPTDAEIAALLAAGSGE